MLSFEYNPKSDTLDIFFDLDGRDRLVASLLKINVPGDHDHLMTSSWGGDELTETVHSPDNVPVHMVTIGMSRTDACKSE